MNNVGNLIIGSGLAGLACALRLAEAGQSVTVLTKANADAGNTNWAQGGIAAVMSQSDNFSKHKKDTIKAGAGHGNTQAIEAMVANGPTVINELENWGVNFAKHNKQLNLTREGGHSERRIAFHGDETGKEIQSKLLIAASKHPLIQIREDVLTVDLLIVNGIAYGAFIENKGEVSMIFASNTILATGGLGQIFKTTTNPTVATGDGFAMAYRGEVEIGDMEFIQFHPTAFVVEHRPTLLLSEALRGEGAQLYNSNKERFVEELAARDVVAKAVYLESQNGQCYLKFPEQTDINLPERFPHIYSELKKAGYDLAADFIPITPAAHFCCGGVSTDLDGRTNIKNLWAFGEVACTGVHGANRLASNSLLEALTFSSQIAQSIPRTSANQDISAKVMEDFLNRQKEWQFLAQKLGEKDELLIKKIQQAGKQIMQEHVGIIRTTSGLAAAKDSLIKLEDELYSLVYTAYTPRENELNLASRVFKEFITALNMVQTSILVVESALKRPHSLGAHQMAND